LALAQAQALPLVREPVSSQALEPSLRLERERVLPRVRE
jgi:hypothetical protein